MSLESSWTGGDKRQRRWKSGASQRPHRTVSLKHDRKTASRCRRSFDLRSGYRQTASPQLPAERVITDDRSSLLYGQVVESWITSICGQTASIYLHGVKLTPTVVSNTFKTRQKQIFAAPSKFCQSPKI